MQLDDALLEGWMRDYYFETDLDIGSSGVHPYSFAEVREKTGLRPADLDAVSFEDSWTLGGPGVRAALADRFAGGDAGRVMVTHGSSEAIFLSMTALLAPGDQVVVLDPVYQQLRGVAAAVGCEMRPWRLDFATGFRPDLDALRELVTERTAMIVVNFPHNPTGVSLSAGEQRELIDIAAAANAYLVWDGAFTELTYAGPAPADPGTRYARALTFGTFSKAYGLPGMRIGWCLAAPEILDRMAGVRDYVSLHLSPLIELIAERVVRHGDAFVGPRRELAVRNRALLGAWVAEHPGEVGWVPPEGGVTAFVHLPTAGDTEQFCRELAVKHRVLLVPGECFGRPGFARLGFGCTTGELTEALRRLGDHLAGGHR
jgi:capreomycidine synthase